MVGRSMSCAVARAPCARAHLRLPLHSFAKLNVIEVTDAESIDAEQAGRPHTCGAAYDPEGEKFVQRAAPTPAPHAAVPASAAAKKRSAPGDDAASPSGMPVPGGTVRVRSRVWYPC